MVPGRIEKRSKPFLDSGSPSADVCVWKSDVCESSLLRDCLYCAQNIFVVGGTYITYTTTTQDSFCGPEERRWWVDFRVIHWVPIYRLRVDVSADGCSVKLRQFFRTSFTMGRIPDRCTQKIRTHVSQNISSTKITKFLFWVAHYWSLDHNESINAQTQNTSFKNVRNLRSETKPKSIAKSIINCIENQTAIKFWRVLWKMYFNKTTPGIRGDGHLRWILYPVSELSVVGSRCPLSTLSFEMANFGNFAKSVTLTLTSDEEKKYISV